MSDNLKGIAERVFRRANFDPSPTPEAVADCYAFINDALKRLALDCPSGFFEERLQIHTEPDQVCASGVATDRIILIQETTEPFVGAYNPWVFRVQLPLSTNGVIATDVGQVQWVTRGAAAADASPKQWAGRWLDITTDDGRIITVQIRSVWMESVTSGLNTYNYAQVSVVTPWLYEIFGEGPFSYRVYTNDYYLPDDVIEMKSARIIGTTYPDPLSIIGQSEAEEAGYANERDPGSGAPSIMFRGAHFALPAPNVAPGVAESASNWIGPEPAGTFEYVYTYCWGRRIDYNPGISYWRTEAQEWRESSTTSAPEYDRVATMRKREPLWESSPSPVSAVATVSAPAAGASGAKPAVALYLPNIEYHLGFMLGGYTDDPVASTVFRRLNVAHSGWHIRVYRRRKTVDFTRYTNLGTTIAGQHVNALHKLDIHDAFYLLAEVRLDGFNEGIYTDNGTLLPDMSRRLRIVNGYHGVRFWPRPDDEYDVELRVIRRPQRLVSASDAPSVHPEATEALVDLASSFLLDKMGEPQLAMTRRAEYVDRLDRIRGASGDIRPDDTPIPKRLARAWGYNRGTGWRRPRQ